MEAALRDRPDVHVVFGRPPGLRRLIDEHDPTIVVLAATTSRAAAALQGLAGLLRCHRSCSWWTTLPRRGPPRRVGPAFARFWVRTRGRRISAAIAAATAGLITLHPDTLRVRATTRSVGVADDRALTARQREILEMMAGGLSNRAIAARLGISAYTVKFHVAAILEALGAGTRTEAVTLGVRSGLISL